MDPHIETELDGFSPGSPKAEEGVDYLRRLKAQPGEDAPFTPAAPADPSVPAAEGSPSGKERRRSKRFQCSGSAEFRVEGSEVRMWGTITDISLHGCYVEMNNTFPVDTRVNLLLEVLGIRVRVLATVRVSYPFLGMGMCFAEIEPAQQQQLEQLLTALIRQNSRANPAPAAADSPSDALDGLSETLAAADLKAMLDELSQFFRGNHLLSREEFCQIAKRSRR